MISISAAKTAGGKRRARARMGTRAGLAKGGRILHAPTTTAAASAAKSTQTNARRLPRTDVRRIAALIVARPTTRAAARQRQ